MNVTFNEFTGNEAGTDDQSSIDDRLGGGVFVTMTRVTHLLPTVITIADNTFMNNTFGDNNDLVDLRRGGGIAAVVRGDDGFAALRSLSICRNEVVGNSAIEGGGMYVELRPRGLLFETLECTIVDNNISGNQPWEPSSGGLVGTPYRGGGLSLNIAPAEVGGLGDTQILSNTITGNSTATSGGTGGFNRHGGGVFVDGVLYGNAGVQSDILMENNVVTSNTAFAVGGGLFSHARQDGPSHTGRLELRFNTFSDNLLTTFGPVEGGGVAFPGNTAFGGTNNIIWGNRTPNTNSPPLANERDWVAWQPLGFPSQELTYTNLVPYTGTGFNLVDAATPNADADPELVGGADVHIRFKTSPCTDQGDPAVGPSALTPLDYDLEDRDLDVLNLALPETATYDRGVDEYTVSFNRGDANGDISVNIADSVAVLDYLFGPVAPGVAQNCLDAYDANDDGSVNIADSVTILDFLFGMTTALPDPFDPGFVECGRDPTVDSVLCDDANANTCL